MHEQDLPAALAADLDGNFEQLVLTYQDRLYGFALRLAGNPQDAEEVAQDSFVRAYQALATYSGERRRTLALRPWLYQIALNVFRNRVRGRHLQLVPLDQDDEGGTWEHAADPAPHPDAVLEQAELKETLDALVASLPERYRLAVILRHVQGLGYREMAAVLKQPLGTVKANVHRGLQHLRQALDAQQHIARPRHTLRGRRGGQ
ncbi:MAG TPA: sigma-70 family RNA polymerase sigma factor [Alphaproteobacteria bacterium]|nr:sigma-70 family RNA polymerase sigma factor [Alphaproteobacteria bacterium]